MIFDLAIFDFDGTLADTVGWFGEAVNVAAQHFNFRSLTKAEFDDTRRESGDRLLERLQIKPEQLPTLARFVQELAISKSSGFSLFPGISEMLNALHAAGVKIAVVSSNAEATVRTVIEDHAHIDFYECDVGFFDKKTRYERVIELARTSASRTIAIGDEGRDIDAARSAGLTVGAVSWGFATEDYLACLKPDFLFDTVAAIEELLLSHR